MIADISPGTNPYHEVFRRPNWTTHPCHVLPSIPCSIPTLNLTFNGTYQENLRADRELWDGFEQGQVYWVERTNLFLEAYRPWAQYPPGYGHNQHGVATAGAATDACPECYLLVLQDVRTLDGDSIRHIAEDLPWVDVVTSTNIPGDPRENYPASVFAEATKRLNETGRSFVAASGNNLVPADMEVLYRGYNLPPWVVMVGGAHPACSAAAAKAARPAEFVASFAQDLPAPNSTTNRGWVSGTSFAAPETAGAFARTLYHLREHLGAERTRATLWAGQAQESPYLDDGELTQTELREAWTRTATYFETTAYQPVCGPPEMTYDAEPVTAAPWEQMGWGYTDPDLAKATATMILGVEEVPSKPAQAHAHMSALMDARAVLYPP